MGNIGYQWVSDAIQQHRRLDKKAVTGRLKHFADIAAILMLVALLAFRIADTRQNSDERLSVNKVYVPDHLIGEDPEMVYDRTVNEAFYGRWLVRIYSIESDLPVCSGSGSALYDEVDSLRGVTLSWYIGKQCNLQPGQYLLRSTWSVGEGYPPVRNTSNVFEVLAHRPPAHRPRREDRE